MAIRGQGALRQTKVAGSGGSSASHQPPYNQDDYDQNSNLINIHGIAAQVPARKPNFKLNPMLGHRKPREGAMGKRLRAWWYTKFVPGLWLWYFRTWARHSAE
jgi:hypothetical protein